MPGLCCGSTGASVLAVSIDGYVRLFLPWLTFEARAARFLTRCLLLVAALAARGQAAPAGDAQGLRFFDIPALPLAEALQRFTASTGHSGLYDSGLVAGRRSRGVAGHYTAESALRLMLGDSGLQARYGSPDTFTLAAVATAAPGLAETLAARQRYYGKLQAAMRALLCGDGCAPGSYRAAVSLWFGDSGQVRRVRLLDSTGSPERDQLLTQRLGRLKLDEAAPPGVGQPITFVIRPGQAAATGDCLA